MYISPQLGDYFQHINKTTYNEKDTDRILKEMNIAGNEYCRIILSHRKWNKQIIKQFIKKEKWKWLGRKKRYRITIQRLITGCRNFIQMNDVRPDRDLEMVKWFYPGRKFHCYTVGFAQAYIMPLIVPCASINVIDINWRIIKAHNDLLNAYNNLGDSKITNLDDFFKSVRISWVANMGGKGRVIDHPASLSFLCRKNNMNLCKAVF